MTSELTANIAKLVTWCDAHRGTAHKRKWEGKQGLSITLYIDDAGRRHVLLARIGAPGPSLQEARTVLAHWPEPVPANVEWTGPVAKGRFRVLLALWKVPAQAEQLKLETSRGQ